MSAARNLRLAEANLDVSRYAAELQRAIRRLDDPGPGGWHDVVERGLAQAYRQRDSIGLASMVQVIVGFLDAAGRIEEALAEIDQALALARTDCTAIAMLQGVRACYLAGMGDVTAALAAVAAAERARANARLPLAVNKSRAHCAVARLITLTPIDLEVIEELMALAPNEIQDSDALVLISYYVPFRYAGGDRAEMHPWVRTFRLAAQAAGHPYRIGDAASFEQAEVAVRQPLEMPSWKEVPTWNWLGHWRVRALRLHAAALRRDVTAAEAEVSALLRVRRQARSARLDECGGFEAYFQVQADAGTRSPEPSPPSHAHLLNLASVFAGAEVVGIAGTQAVAARWLDWFKTALPSHVQTCLEWPVARSRVEALVALRAGEVKQAKALFEQAVSWAAHAEYPVEQGLAQVQLAELLQHHSAPYVEPEWRALRHEGWQRLRSLGIDPAPHAYVVARSSLATRDQQLFPRLTRREAQVLALLAEGLTYQGVAERLGIKWPTVQSMAHRCYEKLGASGRTRAVQAAREFRIL